MWFRGILLIAAILLIAKCSSASEKQVIKGKERILVLPITNNTKAIKGDLDRNIDIALKQYGFTDFFFNILETAKMAIKKTNKNEVDEYTSFEKRIKLEIKAVDEKIFNIEKEEKSKFFPSEQERLEKRKKEFVDIKNHLEAEHNRFKGILSRLEGIDEINRILVQKKLTESNLFEVISIEDQKKALNSLKNCNTNICALELGRILFAKYILNGEISYSSQLKSICVILKLTDVEKGIYFTGFQKCFLMDEKYLKEKGYNQDLYAEYNLYEPNSKITSLKSEENASEIYKDLTKFKSFDNIDAIHNGKNFLFDKPLKDLIDESFQELIKNYRKKIG